MAYSLAISLALGSSKAGLSLGFQLINYDGTDNGTAITSVVTEIGDGYYLWFYDSFPAGFRGGVKVFSQADPSNILSFFSINPQEAEYTDVKISQSTGNNINVEVGHSNADGFATLDSGNGSNDVVVNTGVR